MADQPRRHRNRPDSKQMWDESERRGGKNARDKKDDRVRDREENHRERDRRYRSRSRSPQRDRRDKHRDRRDGGKDKDRERGRQSNRPPQEPKGDERERDGARRDNGRKDRKRDARRLDDKGPKRDQSPRRSASPARSPAKKQDSSSHNSPLPTRPRHGTGKSDSGTSLQFKVGKHDEDATRGGKNATGSKVRDASPEHEDRGRGKGRSDAPNSQGGDPMDEDDVDEDDELVVEDDGLSAMQAMMGFGGFGTTKGSHIPGNNTGGVRKEKKTEYRQYMNRVGGFNRPLSPTRQS